MRTGGGVFWVLKIASFLFVPMMDETLRISKNYSFFSSTSRPNFSVSECRIMEFVSERAREKYAGAPRILDYFSSLLVDLARIN